MFHENSKNRQRRLNGRTVRDEMAFTLCAEPIGSTCLICEKEFSSDEERIKLRIVPEWANAVMCNNCRRRNRGGLVPGKHAKLDAHLAAHYVVPNRNALGLIPLPKKYVSK